MSYTTQDAQALNAAEAAGFDTKWLKQVENSHLLSKIVCPAIPSCEEPEKVLAGAIEALDRFTESTTVWLEVTDKAAMPGYVLDALKLLASYAVRVVITQGESSSHLPGPLLDEELCKAAEAANVGGSLWHPIAGQFV